MIGNKGGYLYEYIDDLRKLNETSLIGKEDICSHLNMENITDAGYMHAKKVYKE